MTTGFPRLAAFCFMAATLIPLFGASLANAAVRLPKIFGDSMVLQQGMPVPVWGWADPGETVAVAFAGQRKTAAADASGKWRIRLDPMPAEKTPRDLIVAGGNTLTFKDVLVGEVWLCAGQSNMEVGVDRCLNADAEKASAHYPAIRHIKVSQCFSVKPLDDIEGRWAVCSPATIGQFSAVGYFFAREIAKEVDVPIGLIGDNWGGSRIEPWTPPAGFRAVPELQEISRAVDSASAPLPAGKHEPCQLFNAMIAPVLPYAIRGSIWYQGEANAAEGATYFHKMKALIGGWRQLWGQGDFPFYFVQLPNFEKPNPNDPAGGTGRAKLREAQAMALAIPNTGMVVTIDVGEAEDNHPKNKQDVGKRLALWALAKTYGKDVVCSGPLYKSHAVEGNKSRITFDYVGGGLIVGAKKGLEPVRKIADGKLKGFAVAGGDRVWQWADAVIVGNMVVVRSEKVAKPVAVRYAFAMNPEGANLYNLEGLPASSFRTDCW